jgi:hypothetical protein
MFMPQILGVVNLKNENQVASGLDTNQCKTILVKEMLKIIYKLQNIQSDSK